MTDSVGPPARGHDTTAFDQVARSCRIRQAASNARRAPRTLMRCDPASFFAAVREKLVDAAFGTLYGIQCFLNDGVRPRPDELQQ